MRWMRMLAYALALGMATGATAAIPRFSMKAVGAMGSSGWLGSGDFNNDGIQDLVRRYTDANWKSWLEILQGDGRGGFAPVASLALQGSSWSLAVADFNGDGALDIAAVERSANTNQPASVVVFSGDGRGGFLTPPTRFGAKFNATYIRAGDLNKDGLPDLVVGGGSGERRIQVFLNNGGGLFTAKPPVFVEQTLGWSLSVFAVGDLNGDGILDFVGPGIGYGQSNLHIWMGNGDGTFTPQTTIALNFALGSVGLADYDGDGILDIVAGAQNGNMYLFRGAGNFSFVQQPPLLASTGNVFGGVADLNNDGVMDILAAEGSGGSMYLFLGNGHGGFVGPVRYDVLQAMGWTGYGYGFGLAGFAIGDWNGDGWPDVAATSSVAGTRVVVMLQNPPQTTAAGQQNAGTAGNAAGGAGNSQAATPQATPQVSNQTCTNTTNFELQQLCQIRKNTSLLVQQQSRQQTTNPVQTGGAQKSKNQVACIVQGPTSAPWWMAGIMGWLALLLWMTERLAPKRKTD